MKSSDWCVCFFWNAATLASAFQLPHPGRTGLRSPAPVTRRSNFFKDMLDGAFQNDPGLSRSDLKQGQLEGPNSPDPSQTYVELTEVQKAWRERQSRPDEINPELIEGSKFWLDLYLAGISDKDPSNDLYGSRVNISSRDKTLGLDLPPEPNSRVEIEFLGDYKCRVSAGEFTSGEVLGDWKTEANRIRFRVDVLGYSRTVQTKGTIQRVAWSNQPEATRQFSSTYTIPAGWVYFDIEIGYGKYPGFVEPKGDGIMRVEQSTGLLGISSKMLPCGRFVATRVEDLPV